VARNIVSFDLRNYRSAMQEKRKRHTVRSISVDPNVHRQRVYPTEKYDKPISELQTIGLKLSRDQAIHLSPGAHRSCPGME
jgi:hypothetical protein